MTEWEDIGKDAEITISFNELMDILKTYDEARIKNGFPCQMDDELYYPCLTWACFSLLWKSKIKKAQIENQKLKKETDDVIDEILKSLGSSDDDLSRCEELQSCIDSLSENTRENMR